MDILVPPLSKEEKVKARTASLQFLKHCVASMPKAADGRSKCFNHNLAYGLANIGRGKKVSSLGTFPALSGARPLKAFRKRKAFRLAESTGDVLAGMRLERLMASSMIWQKKHAGEKKNKHSCDQSHGSVDSVLTSHDSVLTATSDDFWALKKGSCCFFSKGTGNPFVEGKSRLVYADSMLHPSYITMFGWKQIKNCMSQNIQPHPQR